MTTMQNKRERKKNTCIWKKKNTAMVDQKEAMLTSIMPNSA